MVLPMDGEAERWALLLEDGMLDPIGTSYVGKVGGPGWGEDGVNRDSHCPKEMSSMVQGLPSSFFQMP